MTINCTIYLLIQAPKLLLGGTRYHFPNKDDDADAEVFSEYTSQSSFSHHPIAGHSSQDAHGPMSAFSDEPGRPVQDAVGEPFQNVVDELLPVFHLLLQDIHEKEAEEESELGAGAQPEGSFDQSHQEHQPHQQQQQQQQRRNQRPRKAKGELDPNQNLGDFVRYGSKIDLMHYVSEMDAQVKFQRDNGATPLFSGLILKVGDWVQRDIGQERMVNISNFQDGKYDRIFYSF